MRIMKNIIEIEKKLWLEGVEAMQTSMDADCILILPPPISMLRGKEIVNAWSDLPVWEKVAFEDEEIVSRDDNNVLYVSYKVTAIREGQKEYNALCSSSYMKQDDEYILILHQQTPFN